MAGTVGPTSLELEAEAILERAAGELRELLHRAAEGLQPFPVFAGGTFIKGVEAEPPRTDLGCVVVGEDGELYEASLEFGIPEGDFSFQIDREERLRPLALPPVQYIPYAYAGLQALARLRAQRQP